MDTPNRYQTWLQFWHERDAFLKQCGVCYVWVVRDSSGSVCELHNVDPVDVAMIYRPGRTDPHAGVELVAYRVQNKQTTADVPTSNMMVSHAPKTE